MKKLFAVALLLASFPSNAINLNDELTRDVDVGEGGEVQMFFNHPF